MTATEDAVITDELAPQADDTHISRALLMVATVVVLGAVMSILDTTVVNVAIDTLAARFHTTLPTIQWVATGYTLALATVIPLSGWAASRFGTKRLYMGSIAMFVLGSCLSGLAWSSTTIILFRVLQGLGGGMIMPAGMTILTRAAGPGRLGRVMAIMGVPMLLGPILGPILGGWLVTDVSWRWIFFINLPIGIAALVLAFRILPRDVAGQHPQRLDVVDLLLVSPGLALMIYGLAESSSSGGFGSAKVLIPLFAGIVLLCGICLARAARLGSADRPAPVQEPHICDLIDVAGPDVHLRLRRVPAAAALLPVGARRVAADGGRAAGATGSRLDDHDADRRPALGQGRLGQDRAVRPDHGGRGGRLADPDRRPHLVGRDLHRPVRVRAGDGLRDDAHLHRGAAVDQGCRRRARVHLAEHPPADRRVDRHRGMSVILTTALAAQLGHGNHGTIGHVAVPPAVRDKLAAPMATAFGNTFVWACVLLGIALIGSLTLPKHRPDYAHDEAAPSPMLA